MNEKSSNITFNITTSFPLPTGEQIFVTGNSPALGDWKPDGLSLNRIEDEIWQGHASIPEHHTIEYKFTRGTWETEAATVISTAPPNHTVDPNLTKSVSHVISHWIDERVYQPEIEGHYRIHEAFNSIFLRTSRRIIVWLPPSYFQSEAKSYPVLYMTDGQQVFDSKTSTYHKAWEVDKWCTKLMAENRLQEIIVVAVYSTEDRYLEYCPSDLAHEYAKFLLEELKPFIDKTYRTKKTSEHTAVAGSSMGGAINMYLAWQYPDHFFGAACLSPAFEYRHDKQLLDLVEQNSIADRKHLQFYLYCGEGDNLERILVKGMHKMNDILRRRGWNTPDKLINKVIPDAEHNESAWCAETEHWLPFLFPPDLDH